LHKDQEVVYDVFLGSAAEYSEKYKLYDMNELPDYFVSASDIHWRDRIDLQAIAQEHVDAAISSTINLPSETALPDVEQLYLYGWQKGLKGLTIFRDGCARLGILTNEPKKEEKETQNTLTAISIPRGIVEEVPSDLTYRKYKLKTGCGKLYFFVGIDEVEGRIYDVFTNTNAVGGCVVNTQANSRLLSAGIRGGIPIEYLIEQLDKSGTCASYQSVRGHQNGMNAVKKIVAQSVSEEMIEKINMMIGEPISPGKSCSSSIGIILRNILKEFEDDEADMIPYEKVTKEDVTKIKTQECTHSNLKHESGCVICPDCGWSKCD
jgi:ribonucleoside-diphosphate reductase alpha chain